MRFRCIVGYLVLSGLLVLGGVSQYLKGGQQAQERPQVKVPYQNDVLILSADTIETLKDQTLIGQGNVVATYSDATLKADEITYNPETEQIVITGNIEIRRGSQWLHGTRAEIDLTDDTGTIYDADGFTDQELYVQAKRLIRAGPDTYIVEDGFITACEGTIPKWSFTIDRATIHPSRSARLSHTLFRVKNIPVFYLPWVLIPTGEKDRSSGFMLPSTGSSNNKGRRISESFYLVLGRSADIMIHEDFYSKRGLGHGFTLRARPNQSSFLELDGYVIDDRLDQGGASLNGIGETRFANGYRAVADFNLVSNFVYRQVFSDNFFTATRPTENSRFFITNNSGARSFNLLFSREETVFPGRNVVTHKTPSISLDYSGLRLTNNLYFDLNTSIEGLSRLDQQIETPRVSQRFDIFPRIYFSIPLFQGLRLTPRFGVRETFYGESLSLEEDEGENRRVSSEDLHRQYADFSLSLKGWGLSRIHRAPDGGGWKHLIEPSLRYRFIGGIDDYPQIIRFDEQDAIANTNEVEYAIYNRLFTKSSDSTPAREWLSVKIAQKYFFDPSFGGAFETGSVNQFFPLNTLTGHPYGTIERDFSPITSLIRLTPSNRYSFDIRGDLDTEQRQLRNFSVTGSLHQDFISISTTYFVTEELQPGTGKSNQVQGSVRLGNAQRGFSLTSQFSYDAQASRFLNYLNRANYFWDCCGVSLEVYGFNVGVRQERQLRFSFYLKGIGVFGNIRRPEDIF